MEIAFWVEGGVILILLIWLIYLSLAFGKVKKVLGEFFPESEKDAKETSLIIQEKFRKLLYSLDEVKKAEQVLRKGQKDLGLDGLNHLQRVEVLKYNPYNDTGGDQSFSVGLLDGKMNGLILTSLHSRAGTRVYVKLVHQGKSELELSKEEKKVLDKVLS